MSGQVPAQKCTGAQLVMSCMIYDAASYSSFPPLVFISIQELHPETNSPLVVKCIPLPDPKSKKVAQKEQTKIANTLNYEYTLYSNGLLYGFAYAPKIPRGGFGDDAGYRYLVSYATITQPDAYLTPIYSIRRVAMYACRLWRL